VLRLRCEGWRAGRLIRWRHLRSYRATPSFILLACVACCWSVFWPHHRAGAWLFLVCARLAFFWLGVAVAGVTVLCTNFLLLVRALQAKCFIIYWQFHYSLGLIPPPILAFNGLQLDVLNDDFLVSMPKCFLLMRSFLAFCATMQGGLFLVFDGQRWREVCVVVFAAHRSGMPRQIAM